jgi:hypothetical protein
MGLRSCVLTLLIVYPAFVLAGYRFYRHMQKTRPDPLPPGDPRARLVKPLRFLLYVALLPLGLTLSLAILGWLDPLYHLVRAVRH